MPYPHQSRSTSLFRPILEEARTQRGGSLGANEPPFEMICQLKNYKATTVNYSCPFIIDNSIISFVAITQTKNAVKIPCYGQSWCVYIGTPIGPKNHIILQKCHCQKDWLKEVFACCSTTTMHLNNTNAIEVLSRSTTVNKTAGLVRDTSLRTVGSLQLCCTVVDIISLPIGDANPGNVVAMLKLIGNNSTHFTTKPS